MSVSVAGMKGLIVSVQAEDGFPLNTPEHLAAIAGSAVIGGASAIRASLPDNIRAIRQAVDVPIIGIFKKDYLGSEVRITPTLTEVEAVVAAGADIVALDATARPRPHGQSLEDLIRVSRATFRLPLMADVSTFEEGVTAARLGADVVATTLSGYTAYSPQQPGPDVALVRRLAAVLDVPVVAEGRISSPADVRAALEAGAHAVVVGSMITRPHLITRHFLTGLQPPRRPEPVVALDIGGTKIAAGILSADDALMFEVRLPTPVAGGGPAILKEATQIINALLQHRDVQPAAIGISTGGQIDATGHIVGTTDMIDGWLGVPLQQRIAERFGLPTFVLNDGHAAALAEAERGAGLGRASMLCLVIGTGLGGGLTIDGLVQHGQHGLAGSVGQMKVSRNGATIVPLEELVSGPGLVRAYNGRVDAARAVADGEAVAARAHAGDEAAQLAIADVGAWLGLGIANALHVYDAECVVIGGSVAQVGPALFDSARRSLQEHGHASVGRTPILPAALGPRAGLLGAALYARRPRRPPRSPQPEAGPP